MCVIEIPDEVMREAGLHDSHEAAVEIACRLFDAQKINLHAAMKLAQLSRDEMMSELITRQIAVFRPTAEQVLQDVHALEELGSERASRHQ